MVSPDCSWYLRCAHLVGLDVGQPRTKSSLYNLGVGASADLLLIHVTAVRDEAGHDAGKTWCGSPSLRCYLASSKYKI